MVLTPPYLPEPVTDVDLAFQARGVELSPDPIPPVAQEWMRWADRIFFGDAENIQILPTLFLVENDSSPELAWRHLLVVAGCFGSRHQDKMATLAFLSSVWFRWVAWDHNGKHHEIGDASIPEEANVEG